MNLEKSGTSVVVTVIVIANFFTSIKTWGGHNQT